MKKIITVSFLLLILLALGSCSDSSAADTEGDSMETIPLHQVHIFGDWQSTTSPSCAAEGIDARTCNACGHVETRSVPPIGHTFGEWTTTLAATCTENGAEIRTCSLCQTIENRVITATGHSFGEWTVSTAPLCEVKGAESQACQNCAATVTKELPPTGHLWESAWTETLAPSCEEKGAMTLYCQCCDKTKLRETRPTGHSFSVTESERPTLTEDGFELHTCSSCRATDRRTLYATGSLGIEFSKRLDGTCTVTGIGSFSGEHLTLPSYHDSHRVVAIADDAFNGCSSLKTVTLSDTVRSIGKNAFENCVSLESVDLGGGVIALGESAFFSCSALETVSGGDALQTIGKFAFWGCETLSSVLLGEDLEAVEELAFHSCGSLSEVFFGGAALGDWLEIVISSDNAPLLNASRFYYAEATPEISGNYWHYENDIPVKW